MRSAFRTHHRTEIRRLKTAAFARLDHPDARRTLQVVRWGKNSTTGKLTVERLSPITGLPPGAATGARPAAWTRGHWKIENLLRPVRDRTFREDDSKVHAGRLPRIPAGLRNLAVGIHRRDGPTGIAAALRHTVHDCRTPLTAPFCPDESGQNVITRGTLWICGHPRRQAVLTMRA
ncbi:hypothetical protein ACIGW5_20145 [Streptomyces prasinus]|uniref:hypothetical protein n=1 Tax=Streptomyces prasinus TaxID=67345 RepID=UPI0037D2FF95